MGQEAKSDILCRHLLYTEGRKYTHISHWRSLKYHHNNLAQFLLFCCYITSQLKKGIELRGEGLTFHSTEDQSECSQSSDQLQIFIWKHHTELAQHTKAGRFGSCLSSAWAFTLGLYIMNSLLGLGPAGTLQVSQLGTLPVSSMSAGNPHHASDSEMPVWAQESLNCQGKCNLNLKVPRSWTFFPTEVLEGHTFSSTQQHEIKQLVRSYKD